VLSSRQIKRVWGMQEDLSSRQCSSTTEEFSFSKKENPNNKDYKRCLRVKESGDNLITVDRVRIVVTQPIIAVNRNQ